MQHNVTEVLTPSAKRTLSLSLTARAILGTISNPDALTLAHGLSSECHFSLLSTYSVHAEFNCMLVPSLLPLSICDVPISAMQLLAK